MRWLDQLAGCRQGVRTKRVCLFLQLPPRFEVQVALKEDQKLSTEAIRGGLWNLEKKIHPEQTARHQTSKPSKASGFRSASSTPAWRCSSATSKKDRRGKKSMVPSRAVFAPWKKIKILPAVKSIPLKTWKTPGEQLKYS